MSKNEKKTGKKAPLTIAKREPGKAQKTDFMRNLRPFPSETKHPVEDLLGFDNLEAQIEDMSDTQNFQSHAPEKNLFEQPKEVFLDTQNIQPDTLKNEILGQPKNESLDNRNFLFEHPKSDSLSAGALKTETDAPKKQSGPGAQAPKKEILDTQTKPKGKYDYKKYEAARSTVRVNLHIDREIDKKVRQYCLIDSQPKMDLKDFYERAALLMLDHLDTQKAKGLSAEAPLDDRRLKMLYKTRPVIINLYLGYNSAYNEIAGGSAPGKWKAKWTAKDDESGVRFNDTDIRLVELGILQTQANKGFAADGSKIQTFRYYSEEIEKCIASEVGEETLDVVLNYHRQVWRKLTGRELDLNFLEKEK